MPSTADYTRTNYPNNVVPQVRSARSGNAITGCLQCPPDTSLQSIFIDDTSLMVVKGWEVKSKVDLREFFVPVEQFHEYEVVIKAMTEDESITLNYGMIADDNGNIPFICILPLWHTTCLEFDETVLKYRYKGYTINSDADDDMIPDFYDPDSVGYGEFEYENGYTPVEHEWEEINRIFMVSATKNKPIRPIELQNLTGEDIVCKILLGN